MMRTRVGNQQRVNNADNDDGAKGPAGGFQHIAPIVSRGQQQAVRASTIIAQTAVQAPKTVLDTGVKVGQTGVKAVLQAPKQVLDTGVMLGKTGVMVGKTILGTSGAPAGKKSKRAWSTRITPEVIQLELSLECRRLPNKDSFGEADAFACLWEAPAGYTGGRPSTYHKSHKGHNKRTRNGSNSGSASAASLVSRLPKGHECEVGRTQVVRADSNPVFTTKFKLDYKFQEEQTYVVRIYNEDLRYATDLKEHDFLGGCVFTLGELLAGAGCTIARPLRSSKSFVMISATEIDESSEVLEFRFAGQEVGLLQSGKKKNKVLQSKVAKEILENVEKLNVAKDIIDAYYRIEKLNKEDQSWSVVWKSEVIMDNENPTWEGARLPLQSLLAEDDEDGLIRITVWDWNRFVPDETVGHIEVTVRDLVERTRRGIPVFDIMHEQKRFLVGKRRSVKNGVIKALKSHIVQVPSMVKYLAGGCELDLMVAVDCTSANGLHWYDKDSLHYKTEDYWNDYQVMLHKIGSIFEAYQKSSSRSSKHGKGGFSVWGYGAYNKGLRQSCFAMKENLSTAEEMVQAYEETFDVDNNPFFHCGDDAVLSKVIHTARYRSIQSSKEKGKQCYTTLVILTAGAVDDVQASVDAICAAAEDAPLSMVVIGIGPGAGSRLDAYYDKKSSKSSLDQKQKLQQQREEARGFDAIQLLTTGGDAKGPEGDGRPRHSNGVPIARDMVHFTAAEDHSDASGCISEALRLVPEQLAQYFVNAGTAPMDPLPAPDYADARELLAAEQLQQSSSRKGSAAVNSGGNSSRRHLLRRCSSHRLTTTTAASEVRRSRRPREVVVDNSASYNDGDSSSELSNSVGGGSSNNGRRGQLRRSSSFTATNNRSSGASITTSSKDRPLSSSAHSPKSIINKGSSSSSNHGNNNNRNRHNSGGSGSKSPLGRKKARKSGGQIPSTPAA